MATRAAASVGDGVCCNAGVDAGIVAVDDTNEITTAATMRPMTMMRSSSHNCLLSQRYHLRALPEEAAEEEAAADADGVDLRLSQCCAT